MANIQNLIPFTSNQSQEEAKKNGQKGGIASGKARRKRKAMKETLDLLLRTEVNDEQIKDTLSNMGIPKEEQDYQMVLMMSIFKRAMKGDKEDLKFITDMMSETPLSNDEGSSFGGTIIVDDLEYEEDAED